MHPTAKHASQAALIETKENECSPDRLNSVTCDWTSSGKRQRAVTDNVYICNPTSFMQTGWPKMWAVSFSWSWSRVVRSSISIGVSCISRAACWTLTCKDHRARPFRRRAAIHQILKPAGNTWGTTAFLTKPGLLYYYLCSDFHFKTRI